jgi:hypothetical protein
MAGKTTSSPLKTASEILSCRVNGSLLSAERNDILGEMLLAALYKEGKGVAADPKQYEYWNSRVKQRRSDQLWALLDKKTPIGLTGREAIGAAFSLATKIADSTDWILGPECHRWEDGHCIQ